MFHNSKLVGSDSLSDNNNVYMIDTITSFNEFVQLSTQGLKRKLVNENSIVLWHRRLGYIYRRRIEKFVSNEILGPLDFTDFGICVNYIKGKQKHIGLWMF